MCWHVYRGTGPHEEGVKSITIIIGPTDQSAVRDAVELYGVPVHYCRSYDHDPSEELGDDE